MRAVIRTVLTLAVLTLAVLMPGVAFAQSSLFKIGETGAGTSAHVALATLFDTRFVTATSAGNATLEITAWDVTREGHFAKVGAASESGAGTEAALVGLGSATVAAAFVAQNGSLRLVSWSVGTNGAVRRAGTLSAGPIVRVAAAAAGNHRLVTASQDSTGATKLIAWDIDAAGTFMRRGDVAGTPGSAVAVAVISPGLVATATRTLSGKLEVASYSLDAAGKLAAVGSTEGDAVTEVAMAATALDRVVTASRLADGSTSLDAWTVPLGGGAPARSGTAKAASAANLLIAVLGGVKVLTAGLKPDGTLALTSWQVSETPVETGSISVAPAIAAAVTTVGWDRAVSAAIGKDGALKLADWGDRAMGLLHTTWDATSPPTRACGIQPPRKRAAAEDGALTDAPDDSVDIPDAMVVPTQTAVDHDDDDDEAAPRKKGRHAREQERSDLRRATQVIRGGGHTAGSFELAAAPTGSPAPALMFEPAIQGVDPMIAAGRDYVLVSEHGSLEFIFKNGDQAGTQVPSKAGEPTCLSTSAFFAGFTRPRNVDGSTNRSNINLYQRHPANTGPDLQCDITNARTPAPCINEFYDERVGYDPYRQRFFIQAAARGGVFLDETKSPDENARARRYYAVAVSRTEDPRDGFEQWITTENNYTDWPRIASADGVLVTALNACKGADAICGRDEFADLPLMARAQRPMAVVFNMDDMIAAKERPRNWKIDPASVGGGGTIIPVIHHGPTDGWIYFIAEARNAGESVTLYRFKQPADWSMKPELRSASTALKGGTNGFGEGATFQAGKLYFAGADRVAERKPNMEPERFMVRGVRVDVSSTANGFALAPCPSQGCLVFEFGGHDMDDAPGDLMSYELPSMSVNNAGDMIVVHGRTPVKTANPLPQEARYRIFYHDARGLRDGALLHAGTDVLKGIFCGPPKSDTVPTAENFMHVHGGAEGCSDQRHQDYSSAVVDPDGSDFWVALAFAEKNTFKFVAGKVTP
jgi:hypothetical protein